jgi:HlyD family secretion protein
VALGALLQARAQLTGASVRLAQTRLTALRGGVVLTRSVEPGDVVQPARALLVMALDGDVEIVFSPDERNLATLKLGQKARASADAFPQQPFDAEVSYIAPSVDPQRGSIEVRLSVAGVPPTLKPDMTVSVDLTVAARANALTLASDCVRGITTEVPWVLVVEGGRLARRDVKLGIRGDGAIEIVSGLAETAEVVIPDGQLWKVGQRVRAAHEER